jgi:glycerophosphoryl diester phosphodiesterase
MNIHNTVYDVANAPRIAKTNFHYAANTVLTEENPIDALNFAKSIKAKAINPWFKTLTEHQVKQIKKEGFAIYTYTVNEAKDIKKMMSWGVDGVFTNFPDRVSACMTY